MKFDDTLKTFVRHDLKSNAIPMLIGEPGIGKSSWVEDLASEMHTKAFTLACNQLADKSDLTGARLVPIKGTDNYTQVFYPHVVITKAIQYAKDHPNETPILFLDELNRTTPDVTSEALSIPTMRSIGNSKLPDNLKVITAGNDKGNVTSLDTASISRFTLYHVVPDVDTFIDLDPELNPAIVTVLRQHPEYIFQKEPDQMTVSSHDDDDDDDNSDTIDFSEFDTDNELKQLTTPRTISSLSRWLNSYTNSDLLTFSTTQTKNTNGDDISLLQEAIEAHTGHTAFSLSVYDQLLNQLNTQTTKNTVNLKVPKPRFYSNLENAQSMTDLNDEIDKLTDTQKQNAFLYALYTKQTDQNILQNLTNAITSFDGQHIATLADLATNNKLNQNSVDFVQSLSAPIVANISYILQLN